MLSARGSVSHGTSLADLPRTSPVGKFIYKRIKKTFHSKLFDKLCLSRHVFVLLLLTYVSGLNQCIDFLLAFLTQETFSHVSVVNLRKSAARPAEN